MAKITISSREFNQDLAAAKRAAAQSPVIVTDRGRPAFVLTTHEDYKRLAKRSRISLLEALVKADDGPELKIADGLFYERLLRFE